jgi:hemolysin III
MSRIGRISDELANSLTHGLGLVLSLVGGPVLIVLAAMHDAWHVVACSIYAATLIILYACSTLYHSFRGANVKRFFRIFDHSAIYLLIAGTYTPFTLVNMRGAWGWTLFGTVWALTVVGVIWKALFVERFVVVSTVIYIIMGWLVLIAVRPLLTMVPAGGIAWLVAGGILYTLGTIFFGWNKCPYNHAIWHVFVVAGSVCHYFAIMWYVVPARV